MTPDRIGWRPVVATLLILTAYTGFAVGYAVSAPDHFDAAGMATGTDD